MTFRSLAIASLTALTLAAVGFAADSPRAGTSPVPHPYFKDGGTLSWSKSLAEAQSAAKAGGKLIFIEYGREACSNCKALCQNVLPEASVKERLGSLCVGLAADCDHPESDVQKVLRENLKGANMLPFVAIVTRDLKWVAGFSGYKDVTEFVAMLDQVEKSPVLAPSPADAKKLEGFVTQAEQACAKAKWSDVMTASRAATAIEGRSPVRERLAAPVARAREWAEGELTTSLECVKTGGDRATVRASLKKVSTAFAGEPEQKDADAGLKAIDKLTTIEGLAADQQVTAREKAVKDFGGTRWSAVFIR